MRYPKIRVEVDSLLQSVESFRVAPSVMKKHSLECTVKEKDWIQFPCLRHFGKSLVMASLIGEDMSEGEMTVRGIRVECNGALSLSGSAVPVPIVPDKTEREGGMRFSKRVIDLQGFDRGRLRLRKAIFRMHIGINGK